MGRFVAMDDLAQVVEREPALVRFGAVAEILGHRPAGVQPSVFPAAQDGTWLHNEKVVKLQRAPRLVFRNEHLVQLLAWADADDLVAALRRDRVRQVNESHAGELRDKNLAAAHDAERANDERDGLVQSDPEARHARICDWQDAGSALVEKQRDDAAAAAEHIAVAHDAVMRVAGAGINSGADEELVRAELGRAVEIDGVYRLVRRERDDL